MKLSMKWLLGGVLLGAVFPVGALCVDYFLINDLKTPFFSLFVSSPLHWVIASAPLVLGIAFFMIGKGREKVLVLVEETRKKNLELEDETDEQREQINEIMAELTLYVKQLEDMNNHIKNATCLINRDFSIESGFNNVFLEVFGNKEYFESSVFDTVFYSLEGDAKTELKNFFEVCFTNETSSNEMLNNANPIAEFNYIVNSEGKVAEKNLEFEIVRIKNSKGNIEKLMLVFTDKTYDKELEQEIIQKEVQFKNDMELITCIFQHDRDIVLSFIDEINERLKTIENSVQHPKEILGDAEQITTLISIIHSIKGEALTLDFTAITQASSSFEGFLKSAMEIDNTLEISLELLDHFSNLERRVQELNTIAKKLFSFSTEEQLRSSNTVTVDLEKYNEFRNHFTGIIDDFQKGTLEPKSLKSFLKELDKLNWRDLSLLEKELALVSEKSAVKKVKKIQFTMMYDFRYLPVVPFKLIRESLIHLIRNSAVHGIESPDERLRKEKDETGKINIHIYSENGFYRISYMDDGAGFNIEKIRSRIIEKKLLDRNEAYSMSDDKLLEYIFKGDFSTVEKTDDMAGVGSGMYTVKNNITNFLKGSIEIKNKEGNGMVMNISFPE